MHDRRGTGYWNAGGRDDGAVESRQRRVAQRPGLVFHIAAVHERSGHDVARPAAGEEHVELRSGVVAYTVIKAAQGKWREIAIDINPSRDG